MPANIWAQIAKLIASDGAPGDFFGKSCALSADGKTVLLGSPRSLQSRGSAYIFTRNDTSWALQKKILASDGIPGISIFLGDLFGDAVALSADGNTAIVAAPDDDPTSGTQSLGIGSAYVFIRSDGSWPFQAKLTGTPGGVAAFGTSVSLSGDGNLALIGSPGDIDQNILGAAYVYQRSGGTWTQSFKITAADSVLNDNFGKCVSLSADGQTALIEANINGSSPDTVAYVFVSSSGPSWVQQKKFTNIGSASFNVPASMSLSANGSTALIGGNKANGGKGAAYIFNRTGTTWTSLPIILEANDGVIPDSFGFSAVLSANGNTALVSATGTNSDQGQVYIYVNSGGVWTQQVKIAAKDGAASNFFGRAVCLSANADLALICASSSNNASTGAAYIFQPCNITISDLRAFPATVAPSGPYTVSWVTSQIAIPTSYKVMLTSASDSVTSDFSTLTGSLSFTAPGTSGTYPVNLKVISNYSSDCSDARATTFQVAPLDTSLLTSILFVPNALLALILLYILTLGWWLFGMSEDNR